LPRVKFGNFVETEALAEFVAHCSATYADQGIMTVVGEPGLGKTIAVESFRRTITDRVAYLEVEVEPTVKSTLASLYTALTGDIPSGTKHEIRRALLNELAKKETALICIDEAQRFQGNREWEMLRSLFDDGSLQLALVFIANPLAYKVICRHPMLDNRVTLRYTYPKMRLKEALSVMPRFHSVFFGTDPVLLTYIHRKLAHTNLRLLRNFTREALHVIDNMGAKRLTQDVVDAALIRMGRFDPDQEGFADDEEGDE
jgi:AAA domain